jgi:hypothetical protein
VRRRRGRRRGRGCWQGWWRTRDRWRRGGAWARSTGGQRGRGIWLGWILIGCVIDRHREGESAWQGEGWGCWLQPCVFMFLMAEEEELDRSSTSIKCLNPNPWCKHLKQAPWRVPPSQGIQTKVIPSPLLSVRGCEWGPTPQSSFTIH